MLFELLLIFQVKHFLADFPLQGSYMLGKFMRGYKWILPLSAHCLVHAIFTLVICLYFTPSIALSMAMLDFAAHFIMDRVKASPNLLGRFKALSAKEYMASSNQERRSNIYFWWSLGGDQMWHHCTHYFIIWNMCQNL